MPFRALIDACWKEKYTLARFTRDLIAGITVGIIAIPLAMALAIGSGVAPQYGLYTAAVAGIIIALTGGSRFSVSGPTAAFVVILYPVSQQFGLAGLLVATLMSGVFLILFGLARFGRLIEYIPLSVTLGFTSGIGITIGTMQIKDFLGLQMAHVPEHYLQKVAALVMALPTANPGDAAIGVVTLGTLILWPRLGIRLPGHLPALLAGCAVMAIVNLMGATSRLSALSSTIFWLTVARVTGSRSCCRSWCCRGICLAPILRSAGRHYRRCCRRPSRWRCSARLNHCCVRWSSTG